MTTTNAIYRCEEFEVDNASIYDDIEENPYDDLNEETVDFDGVNDVTEECDEGKKPELPSPRENVYIDLISDETEGREQASEHQTPSPGPVTPSQDRNQDYDYEGLKERKSDHVYLHASAECGENTKDEGEDQDQSTTPQEQDSRSTTTQDQDSNSQQQSPDQTTQPQEWTRKTNQNQHT